jgi:hypothetical protein
MIIVLGDVLEAFSVELDMTADEFGALDEQTQKDLVVEVLGGGGWGAERDIRIDDLEELE